MKIFISVDIEGITGVTGWNETVYGGQGYEEACRQMTAETVAACEAAMELGYDVVVKDGHGDANNIDINELPRGVQFIKGWMVSPAAMMGGLDESFAGVVYIGYHSAEGTDTSPLSHTIEHELFNYMKLNGKLTSEFSMNSLWAAGYGVPSIFISGDKGICDQALEENPDIEVFATKECVGNATINVHPQESIEKIKLGVKMALEKTHKKPLLEDEYTLEICFKEHQKARCASWYPGAVRIDSTTVSYTAKEPKELMTARMFMTGI